MTKRIRIENADTGSTRLMVEVMRVAPSPEVAATVINKHDLDHPCQVLDLYVTPDTMIVIRERKAMDAAPLKGFVADQDC